MKKFIKLEQQNNYFSDCMKFFAEIFNCLIIKWKNNIENDIN